MPNALDQYFINVDGSQVNFSSGFSSSMKSVLDNINANFQRIINAPFMQGLQGNSVVEVTEDIYENDNFTYFGLKIVEAIYYDDIDTSTLTTSNGYSDLVSLLGPYQSSDMVTINGTDHYSCEFLDPDSTDPKLTEVKCYKVENGNNKKVFQCLVYFIDKRIELLQGNSQSLEHDFKDRTCVLYGTATWDDTNNIYVWSINKYQIIPTLYFDPTVGQFCWQINGLATGVTAQGIKGDKGDKLPLWVTTGVRYPNTADIGTNIYLIDVLSTNLDTDTHTIDDIQEGDMVYCWFTEDTDNTHSPDNDPTTPDINNIKNFTIGLAQNFSSNRKIIIYDYHYDFATITNDILLRPRLDEIGYYSNPESPNNYPPRQMRGLYIPGTGEPIPGQPTGEEPVSMIYTNRNFETHITPTKLSKTYGDAFSNNDRCTVDEDNALICMDYRGISSVPILSLGTISSYRYELRYSNNELKNTFKSGSSNNSSLLDLRLREGKHSSLEFLYDHTGDRGFFIGTGHGYFSDIDKNTYDGHSDVLDNTPAIKLVSNNDDGSINAYNQNGSDFYNYRNIFNFLPTKGKHPEIDTEAANLNFQYVKHNGMSRMHNEYLSLCFNPKSEIINEGKTKRLRIYLPTVQWLRDCTYGNGSTDRFVNDGGFTNTARGVNATVPEVFLYNKVRFLSTENLEINTDEFYKNRSITYINASSNTYMSYVAGASLVNHLNAPSYIDSNMCSAKSYIGKDYFEIELYKDRDTYSTYDNNSIIDSNNSVFWGRITGLDRNNRSIVLEPLLKCKLERSIYLENTGKYLADELWVLGVVGKRCNYAEPDDPSDIYANLEFSLLITCPGSFSEEKGKSIIDTSRESYSTDLDYIPLYVNKTPSPDFGSSQSISEIFRDALCVNFLTVIRGIDKSNTNTYGEWYVSNDDGTSIGNAMPSCGSIYSGSNISYYHAGYKMLSSSSDNSIDGWLFSCQSGDSTDGNPTFERFGWREFRNMYNGNSSSWTPNNPGGTLYLPSNNLSIDLNDRIKGDYIRYYDFYELNIGNTIISSKPRKENMECVLIPKFNYLINSNYSHTDADNTIIYTVPTYHDWTSAEYIKDGICYPTHDIDAPCKDMCHEILNSLSIAMMMSEINSQNTKSLVNTLEDEAVINVGEVTVKSPANKNLTDSNR